MFGRFALQDGQSGVVVRKLAQVGECDLPGDNRIVPSDVSLRASGPVPEPERMESRRSENSQGRLNRGLRQAEVSSPRRAGSGRPSSGRARRRDPQSRTPRAPRPRNRASRTATASSGGSIVRTGAGRTSLSPEGHQARDERRGALVSGRRHVSSLRRVAVAVGRGRNLRGPASVRYSRLRAILDPGAGSCGDHLDVIAGRAGCA
jgi:hypothetical protein